MRRAGQDWTPAAYPRAALAAAALLLGACGGGMPPPKRAAWITLQVEQGEEQILDLSTGRAVTFDAMVADLATAKAVYVGERHDDANDHAIQYAVLEALLDHGAGLALGLEMFQRPFQKHLDDWLASRIDEEDMLRRTEFETRWSFDYDFYRPILETAKVEALPVFALNAPKEVTRAIAHGGLAALDPAQLEGLPELKLDDAAHRKLVEADLNQHHLMEKESLDRYYAAQVVWDETMAETVATAVTAPRSAARMLILAGRLHVQGGLGIPRRAARRGAAPYKIVIPIDERDPLLSWRGPADERPADYLWVIPTGT